MTFLDRWDILKTKYFSRTPSKAGKKETDANIFKPSDYGEEGKKWNIGINLTPALRRELAFSSPFFMKATKKKNLDRFRAWFELENINTGKPPSQYIKKIIEIFDSNNDTRFKFVIASICADIYGDGFILKKYEGDILIEKGDNKGKPDLEKPPQGKLVRLEIMNPENLKEMKYLEGKKGEEYKKQGIQHYYYNNAKSDVEYYIHPKRLMHFKDDQLPFSNLGISKVDILRNIILSEADIDIATGEILKWFSHGILHMTKIGMQPNERKKILEVMAKHPNFYANDDRYKLEVHNPRAISPKEFYDYIVLIFASVFVMPVQVLTGVQIGKVTGAETGYSDYYRDVKDKQELYDSPLLNDLYTEVLAAYKQKWRYNITWNDIFVGELAEAELLGKRAATVQILLNTNPPTIDQGEGREIMNKGKVYLDPDKKIKAPKVTLPPIAKDGAIIKKEKPIGKEGEKKEQSAYDTYQNMIDKRKKFQQAKVGRELGKIIQNDEDKLFGKVEDEKDD